MSCDAAGVAISLSASLFLALEIVLLLVMPPGSIDAAGPPWGQLSLRGAQERSRPAWQ